MQCVIATITFKKKTWIFFLSFNVLNEWAPLAHMMHTRYIQIEGRKETEKNSAEVHLANGLLLVGCVNLPISLYRAITFQQT